MGNTAETHVNPFWNVNVVPFWSLKGKKWVMPCFPVIYTFISRFLRHNLRKMLPKRSGRVTLQFQTVFCVPCTDMFYFSLSQESHIETQCNLHHTKSLRTYICSQILSYRLWVCSRQKCHRAAFIPMPASLQADGSWMCPEHRGVPWKGSSLCGHRAEAALCCESHCLQAKKPIYIMLWSPPALQKDCHIRGKEWLISFLLR